MIMQAERSVISIPNAKTNPIEEARVFYGEYYKKEQDDSSASSRQSLLKRAQPHFNAIGEAGWVLDLGAGRQILEADYKKKQGVIPPHVVTVDIADMTRKQLFAPEVPHVQASGTHLPFPRDTFDLAVSNLAFDFMPERARRELQHTVKPGSPVLLNLHHPGSIIPRDLDDRIATVKRKMYKKETFGGKPSKAMLLELAALEFKKSLKDNHSLFESEEQIREVFEAVGFQVNRTSLAKDRNMEQWWEVDMRKPYEIKKKQMVCSITHGL